MVDGIDVPYFVGIDFSPRAVAYATKYGAYDRVVLAESAALPLETDEVDVSMSLENLEHLYPDEVESALAELVRVARQRIVITTPWPWEVVNVPWITEEIAAAQSDPDPLGADEFNVIAGAVHKSTLLPEQMARAGFRCMSVTGRGAPLNHPVYVGEESMIDVSKIGLVLGIERADTPEVTSDHRAFYVRLLVASLALQDWVPAFKPSWRRELRARRVKGIVGRLLPG